MKVNLDGLCRNIIAELRGPRRDEMAEMVRQMVAEIKRLEAVTDAQADIIAWYESEHERSCFDDDDVPEELRKAEERLEAAKHGDGA